jgi:hypothetical protein
MFKPVDEQILLVELCVFQKSHRYRLKLSDGSRPSNAINFGYEADSPTETFALAVAHTPYGNLLGKAKHGTCWFADWNTIDSSGSEAETTRFSWIVPDHCEMFLVSPTKVRSTESLLGEGFLTSGYGGASYFSAIACTAKYGLVPGMATFPNSRCLFSYGGHVYSTESFYFVATGEEGLEIEFRKPQAEPSTRWLSWIFTSPAPAAKETTTQEQFQVPADKTFPMSHDATGLLAYEPIAAQDALTRCTGAVNKSCCELINRWDQDSLQESQSYESGDCQVDCDRCYSEGGIRFRILKICRKAKGAAAKGSPRSIVAYACAHVEILKEPPHFGRERIREALRNSLRSTESCRNGLRTKLYRRKLAKNSELELEKEGSDNTGTYRLHSLNLSIKTYSPVDQLCVHSDTLRLESSAAQIV